MNVIFAVIVILSLLMICFIAPENAVGYMLEGTTEAVRLALKLVAVYALWTGILKIMERAEVDKKINKLLSPMTKRLFKGENEKARAYASVNFTANLLGMGGVATSSGIETIKEMDASSGKITPSQTLFYMINVTSIQLLPTTVIALRSEAGSVSPADIILPALLATTFTTLVGVIAVKTIERFKAAFRRKRVLKRSAT